LASRGQTKLSGAGRRWTHFLIPRSKRTCCLPGTGY
jgi:hypothetical protein